MSDRPNDQNPDEPQNSTGQQRSGGWRTPKQATGPGERHAWRTPEEQQQAQPPAPSVSVPTLPRELSQQSAQEGAWHLPSPTDTSYSSQDVSVIPQPETPEETSAEAPAAELAPAAVQPAAEGETAAQPLIPFEETSSSTAATPEGTSE